MSNSCVCGDLQWVLHLRTPALAQWTIGIQDPRPPLEIHLDDPVRVAQPAPDTTLTKI